MPAESITTNTNTNNNTNNNNNNRSNNDDNKRRSSNKFFLAPEKYIHSLRKNLLLSNFDKNMTVEKARFEPTEETSTIPVTTSTSQHNSPKIDIIPPGNNLNDLTHNDLGISPPSEMTYVLTMSPSAPTLTNNNTHGNNNVLLTTTPLTTSHSVNDRRRGNPVRGEGCQNSSTSRKKHNNKKQTKQTMHGNASPAEVFHRNLVDAVSNVEDSDENEHYVYPFSGNESSNHHFSDISSMHRPLSVRSTPNSLLYESKKRKGGLSEWLKQAFDLKNSQQQQKQRQQQPQHYISTLDEEDEDEWSSSEYSRRPKLRNNVKSYQSHHKPSILTRWQDSFNKSISPDKTRKPKRMYPVYPYDANIHSTCGYTSDEEDAPLLLRRQKRIPRNKKNCKNIFRNTLLGIFSVIAIFFIFIIYKAQPLAELTVDIGRILATDKELIFDLKVQAENWNWWTVHVTDADISIFAFSQIVPSSIMANATSIKGVDPAEYLGGFSHFDEPLSIQSSAFDKTSKEAISQIRIKSPGADISGNERWSRMIRYPYGLVVRGVLKYRPIPLIIGLYPQSIAICNVTQVDPTTGSVSSDPDKSICTGQDQVNIFSRY